MPSPNPTTRREYRGAAAGTTLQNSMTNTDTSFVLVSANNWPTGSVGKFVVTINRGQADEEKILCDTQSSRNVACLLANRGFDSTTAQSHAAGATVECTISAFDADEWNAHTSASAAVHGFAGDIGTTLTTATGAWTSWSPTFTGFSGGTNIFNYKLVGKTLNFHANIVGATATASLTTMQFTLPSSPAGNAAQPVNALKTDTSTPLVLAAYFDGAGKIQVYVTGNGGSVSWANGAAVNIYVAGTIEIA